MLTHESIVASFLKYLAQCRQRLRLNFDYIYASYTIKRFRITFSHNCEVRAFGGDASVIFHQLFLGEYFISKGTGCNIISRFAVYYEFMERRICFHNIEKLLQIFYHMVLIGIRSKQVRINYVGTVQSQQDTNYEI